MDPINLLVAINLFVTTSANFSGAKKGFKTSITKVVERPETFLQKTPPNVAALILVLTILSIFKIGTMPAEFEQNYQSLRIIGLILFVLFSWVQIISYKTLGNNYAQDIVIMKGHNLVSNGIYRFIRHPQYVSQVLSDLGAGLALMSYLVTPLVLLVEIPLFIMRAIAEEKMLSKHFWNEHIVYKKRSGFIIPFLG
ncbi:MAG: isoprenylcysteine carboxyl methyltransferase [Ignavibacteria bacterium]|nr:MAG: isoprenylcysteine carboxyl methyltransferase [Ignavibacteria bacterium]KAF0157176.1 MAG: isoprenylcysteine carboxyl methyltransferase [Ignavibacteria bacterium]